MQLSLYTLITRDFSIEESIEMAAAAGFDAVDWRQARGEDDTVHLTRDITDAEAEELRGKVAAAGLHISGLTTYYQLGKPGAAEASAELEGLRRSIQVTQALGARFMRCSGPHTAWGTDYEATREAFRRQIDEIAVSLAEAGVTLTIEQHGGGTFFASAGQILDMLRDIGNEYTGVVYDPGNCLHEGYESPAVQVDMLRNLIKAVHVKNAMPKSAEGPAEGIPGDSARLDKGLLDWPAIIAQLHALGYDNYVTLEDFFGGFDSVQEKLDWDAAYLREILQQL